MNGFIPALVAVLLAELGQRASARSGSYSRGATWIVMTVLIVAASIAGQVMVAQMTDWAGALLIAVALALAATGQFLRVRPRATSTGVLWAFWSGGAPLLAFAFAIRFGAIASALGTLAGLIVAAVLTAVAGESGVALRLPRAMAGIMLASVAAFVAASALRLV